MIGIMAASSFLPDLPAGSTRVLRRGETLFRVGDPAMGLVLVRSGSLELRRLSEAGARVLMQRAGPGDTLAEGSLFEERHHCEAMAVEDALVEVLSRTALETAASRDASVPLRLAAYLARRLVEARARAELLALPGAADRIMAAFGTRRPDVDDVRWLGGTWGSLAAECGLSPEATYRTLASLERGGKLRRVSSASGGVGAKLTDVGSVER